MKKAGIISIGNEILAGLTVDTNAAYLSKQLLAMGIPVVSGFTVGDQMDSIVGAINQAAEQSDIVLITGGLGPTDDDITRQGLAEFIGVELEFREDLLERISAFFDKQGSKMAEKNKVQAYIPASAEPLANNFGTAPGIFAEYKGKVFVCMPGVPVEMKRMFEESVGGKLAKLGDGQVVIGRKLKCFGVGESTVAQAIGDIMKRGRNPLVNCTVTGGIITLHIVAIGENSAEAEKMIEKDAARLRDILGELVYGEDEQTLAEVVGEELREQKKTVAVAESCTGGLIAKLLTDVPGSSGYFTHGWVTYSNRAKTEQLGVSGEVIEKYGAVSEEVARQMARCARERAGTDFGIGVTGIAGPGGGSEQKPVGLVYIAVGDGASCDVERYVFSHSRERIRLRTALTALNTLRMGLLI